LKENRKKDDHSTLFNGKGIVLTSNEFEAAIKQQKEYREQQQAQKERNHQLQALKKDVKAAIEARWEEVKRDHKEAVKRW